MSLFNFIKSQVTILDVVQEYTTLKKNGAYWKGCCPFHHEKTPSFSVSPHKEIFYCFGCHMGGDAISFIEKIEQCSPLEAAHYLAQRFNIAIPENIAHEPENAKTQQERDSYFALCQQVAAWCHKNLQKNAELTAYVTERGFSAEMVNHFCLGYFPGGPSAIKAFLAHMRTHNILASDLVDAHIIAQSKSNSFYSPFEERLMFPIKDHLGRWCGFGGRIVKPHDDRPKYYNSKENEFFTKGSLLFGFDLAKKSMQETGTAFLVEGYTDCMAMVQHGYPNTVATLGTACTSTHLKTLSRYVQQLYLVYDNDKAGQQAVMRIAQLCWQVDLELFVISLPEGQDPASWLKNNKTLEPLAQEAKDLFIFFIDSLGKNFSGKLIPEKVRLTRSVVDIIRTIDDPLKQDFLLQKAAKTFDIPFQALKQELGRAVHVPDSAPNSRAAVSQEQQTAQARYSAPQEAQGLRTQASPSNHSQAPVFQALQVGEHNQPSHAPSSEAQAVSGHRADERTPEQTGATIKPMLEAQVPVSLLEKQIFCAIINDMQLLNSSDYLRSMKYSLNYLPQHLVAVLEKLHEAYTRDPNIAFTSFFNTLNNHEKLWVSQMVLETSEYIATADFEQLIHQLHKTHWKKIVFDIKQQIARANRAGNNAQVEKILQDFLYLKQKMMPQSNSLRHTTPDSLSHNNRTE